MKKDKITITRNEIILSGYYIYLSLQNGELLVPSLKLNSKDTSPTVNHDHL